MKKYRVNGSEHFNLMSMYDKVKCEEIDYLETGRGDFDDIERRIEELESLLDKAPCVGSLVDWPTLKRIREIRDERNFIRYNIAKAHGASEEEAAYAFM